MKYAAELFGTFVLVFAGLSTAVIAGLAVLGLVLVVTVLSVTFATRAAMATNRPVIEVLHFIGAKDNFIAAHFQKHFLQLGLKGGLLGGGVERSGLVGGLQLFALLSRVNPSRFSTLRTESKYSSSLC